MNWGYYTGGPDFTKPEEEGEEEGLPGSENVWYSSYQQSSKVFTSLADAMASALSDYLSNDSASSPERDGPHNTRSFHSTHSETHTILLYTLWGLLLFFALTGFIFASCWFVKKAIRWLAIIFLATIVVLLIIDISIHIN